MMSIYQKQSFDLVNTNLIFKKSSLKMLNFVY